MKVNLMFENNELSHQQKSAVNGDTLMQDLELSTLFNVMSAGDEFLYQIVSNTFLYSLSNTIETISYRQEILKDCLQNKAEIRELYKLSLDAKKSKEDHWWGLASKYPISILHGAVGTLQGLMQYLKQLKSFADLHYNKFASKGLNLMFKTLIEELNDEYLNLLQEFLDELKFKNGMLISANLGKGNKGSNYILRKQTDKKNWLQRLLNLKNDGLSFEVHPRDDSGARYLGEIKEEAIIVAARILGQSMEHVLNFFEKLKDELAFYIACLNLYEKLQTLNEPVSFPILVETSQNQFTFKGLYDICLALTMNQKIVGNTIDTSNKDLIVITGANQGGKSTFLRSIGIAQLMMQSGMFVPAEKYTANLYNSLFTHYKRKEDFTMQSGKLDEELKRMSEIADEITVNTMILFNESFAATNEREGSEIARQIVTALIEKKVKVFFVTHLYEFSHSLFEKNMENILFLRANRLSDGTRTFALKEGEPLQTSFGEDLYKKIFKDVLI
jgi:DNA mismatch repair ATPase MutS